MLLTAVAGGSPAAAGEVSPRPNVLFVMINDLNDWVGHMGGHPDVMTPNIDRLAARGVSFLNAHTASPLCSPARSALLSGLRPATSGIYRNERHNDWVRRLADVVTLPQHFSAHGYRTLGTGAIFHGQKEDYFDEVFNVPATQGLTTKVGAQLDVPSEGFNGLGFAEDWRALDISDSGMRDHQVVSWAIEQLAAPSTRPLFLAVGLNKAHSPWYLPREYFDLYDPERISLPAVLADDLADLPDRRRKKRTRGRRVDAALERTGQRREAIRAYLATISFADRQIGRLLDALDANPGHRETIVVLTSDHGNHLGEKGHWGKSTLWEEATRVPLIFVVPGVTEPGGRSSRPVDHMAIYPTLAELAGLSAPGHTQGVSLAPLLRDPAAPWDQVALSSLYVPGSHAVRSERWRYIRYADGGEELYDHQNDPNEWHNLASAEAHADVKRELRRWMPRVAAPAVPVERERTTNIVLLNLDGAGKDLFETAGLKKVQDLVQGGVRFTRAHTVVPRRQAGLACLLRGQYAHRELPRPADPESPASPGFAEGLEAYTRDLDPTANEYRLVDNDLPWRLRGAGYHTMHVGRYFDDPPPAAGYLPTGWDEFYGVQGDEVHGAGYLFKDRQGVAARGRMDAGAFRTEVEATRAVELLSEWRAEHLGHKPFFLHLSPQVVGEPAAPAGGGATADRGRSLRAVDELLGRVLEFLRQTRDERGEMLLDNTVVFLTSAGGAQSVGGPALGDIEIPLVVWDRQDTPGHEGRVADGAVAHHLVANIDLAPTILDLAEVSVPSYMDGKSLAGILADPSSLGAEAFRRTLVIESWGLPGTDAGTPGGASYRARRVVVKDGTETRDDYYVVWDNGDREHYDLARDSPSPGEPPR